MASVSLWVQLTCASMLRTARHGVSGWRVSATAYAELAITGALLQTFARKAIGAAVNQSISLACCLVQTASIDVLDRDGREVDAFETANINAPQFRSHTRTAERQDSTGRAEIIFGSPCMPLIERKLFDRRQWTKTFLFDAMDKGASSTTD